jgi:hypothetical protein
MLLASFATMPPIVALSELPPAKAGKTPCGRSAWFNRRKRRRVDAHRQVGGADFEHSLHAAEVDHVAAAKRYRVALEARAGASRRDGYS